MKNTKNALSHWALSFLTAGLLACGGSAGGPPKGGGDGGAQSGPDGGSPVGTLVPGGGGGPASVGGSTGAGGAGSGSGGATGSGSGGTTGSGSGGTTGSGSGGTTGSGAGGMAAGGTVGSVGGSTGTGGSVTVPGTAGTPPAPRLPGGGAVSDTPLAPGCTPASAHECPSPTGACATGGGTTVTVRKYGTLCLYADSTLTLPATTVEYLEETVGGQTYYRFRVTFHPDFVDNTYGKNSIGWSPVRGHRWGDLVGSDHTELQLYDASGALALHFKMDYVTADASQACGYGTLGVTGGDGSVIAGNPAHVLAVSTSIDRNLNGCGYCVSDACEGSCTVNSPATDSMFTPNPLTPNWDYRMQYDVWIDSAAFGAAGFGKANISYVHASPAKTPQDTLTVTPKDCPPQWDNPYSPPSSGGDPSTPPPDGGAGGCPAGYEEYLLSEGAVCLPVPTTDPGGGQSCPDNYALYLASEGAICVPTPTGGTCPMDWSAYLTSEGASTCTPTPSGDMSCPVDWALYLSSEGAACVPVPTNGVCPAGYQLDLASEGKYCI